MSEPCKRVCERCTRSQADKRNPLEFAVKYDATHREWLCNECWFHTPPGPYPVNR